MFVSAVVTPKRATRWSGALARARRRPPRVGSCETDHSHRVRLWPRAQHRRAPVKSPARIVVARAVFLWLVVLALSCPRARRSAIRVSRWSRRVPAALRPLISTGQGDPGHRARRADGGQPHLLRDAAQRERAGAARGLVRRVDCEESQHPLVVGVTRRVSTVPAAPTLAPRAERRVRMVCREGSRPRVTPQESGAGV